MQKMYIVTSLDTEQSSIYYVYNQTFLTGTHYLTSVTAGAFLVKDDYYKKDYMQSSDAVKNNVQIGASASFLDLFNMSASYG